MFKQRLGHRIIMASWLPTLRSTRLGMTVAGVTVIFLFFLRAVEVQFDHSLFSIDGAMQTWFALDNLSAGRQLGEEFQSYLGIVIILFLLPFYHVFGGNLFASTLAANAAVLIGLAVAIYVLLWQVRSLLPATRWLLFAALFALLYLTMLGEPGHSLRPLRWSLPYLTVPFLLPLLRRMARGGALAPGLLAGIVLGLGLLWSNDAGIPTVAAAGVAILLCGTGGVVRALQRLAGFISGVCITAGLVLLVVTHGAPSGWLFYNFISVPTDQIWYFGPWSRESRIIVFWDLAYLLDKMGKNNRTALTLLLICLVVAILRLLRGRGAPAPTAAFVFLGLSAIGIALLPQLGGHIEKGYNMCLRLVGFAAPFIVFQKQGLAVLRPKFIRRFPKFFGVAAISVAVAVVAVTLHDTTRMLQANGRNVPVDDLGFRVDASFAEDAAALSRLRADLDLAGVPPNRRLLSTYTSALDIILAAESPTSFGSIIHALGPESRRQFLNVVTDRRVKFVTTIHPDYSGWARWSLRANWDFFQVLHLDYVPVAANSQHVIWERRNTPLPAPQAQAECTFTTTSEGLGIVSVESPKTDLVDVAVSLDSPLPTGRGAIITAIETSPVTRNPFSIWSRNHDAPRYGVRPTETLSLVLPVSAVSTSEIQLQIMDGRSVPTGTCTATLVRWPDLIALPSFATFQRIRSEAVE